MLEPMKSQAPSTKLQINLKFQYQMTKTKNRFGISNLGHCDLFGICDLLFGISSHSIASTKLSGKSFV
jgi:hypothetical protein